MPRTALSVPSARMPCAPAPRSPSPGAVPLRASRLGVDLAGVHDHEHTATSGLTSSSATTSSASAIPTSGVHEGHGRDPHGQQ